MVNASLNLPIYFFAGKTFRETSLELIKCFLPPFIIRFYQDNNIGIVVLAKLGKKTNMILISYDLCENLRFLKSFKIVYTGQFCWHYLLSDGDVSNVEPSTSAVVQAEGQSDVTVMKEEEEMTVH